MWPLIPATTATLVFVLGIYWSMCSSDSALQIILQDLIPFLPFIWNSWVYEEKGWSQDSSEDEDILEDEDLIEIPDKKYESVKTSEEIIMMMNENENFVKDEPAYVRIPIKVSHLKDLLTYYQNHEKLLFLLLGFLTLIGLSSALLVAKNYWEKNFTRKMNAKFGNLESHIREVTKTIRKQEKQIKALQEDVIILCTKQKCIRNSLDRLEDVSPLVEKDFLNFERQLRPMEDSKFLRCTGGDALFFPKPVGHPVLQERISQDIFLTRERRRLKSNIRIPPIPRLEKLWHAGKWYLNKDGKSEPLYCEKMRTEKYCGYF